jgi:hypothetical protein
MPKHSKSEIDEELKRLREWIKPGDTLYTILEHRAASGMSRWIRCLLVKVDDKGKPYFLHPNHAISVILGLRRDRTREGVFISGCGMDMGFHIAYSLGCKLWPDDTPEPHGMRNGEPDRDGGYALKHQWL